MEPTQQEPSRNPATADGCHPVQSIQPWRRPELDKMRRRNASRLGSSAKAQKRRREKQKLVCRASVDCSAVCRSRGRVPVSQSPITTPVGAQSPGVGPLPNAGPVFLSLIEASSWWGHSHLSSAAISTALRLRETTAHGGREPGAWSIRWPCPVDPANQQLFGALGANG